LKSNQSAATLQLPTLAFIVKTTDLKLSGNPEEQLSVRCDPATRNCLVWSAAILQPSLTNQLVLLEADLVT